jgi:hypothetical protein
MRRINLKWVSVKSIKPKDRGSEVVIQGYRRLQDGGTGTKVEIVIHNCCSINLLLNKWVKSENERLAAAERDHGWERDVIAKALRGMEER